MRSYVVRRLLAAIPVLFGVVTVVFFLLHLVPGDPVDLMLGESAMPAQRAELRARLHLDDPLWIQYASYLGGLSRLDLGTSIATGEPVLDRLAARYPGTLALAGAAMAVALALAIPSGLLAAIFRNSPWDLFLMTFTLLGLSIPAFWLGPLLILAFAYHLGWFPISGSEGAFAIVLPAVTLGTGMAALLARMTRGAAADVLREDFVRTARAKGLPFRRIFFTHALRNALLPVLTVAGLQAGALLAGSVITEKVFSWPGIGLEMLEAIERRDYPVVQGAVLAIAASYVAVNLATDLLYGVVDPRIRVGRRRGA
jgi:peptide/nickel transport system permease protein